MNMSNESHSLRTPMARVRHLGSAHGGTHHVMHMRFTAYALLPLTISFVWIILGLIGKDYNVVRAELAQACPAIITLLFLLTGIYHMKLGMQTIIEDYVHGESAKHWSLWLNAFFCFVIGLSCVYAVLRISFV
jgi:succinate dehydrogenase / fumarate reductase, membrane anchor subunit